MAVLLDSSIDDEMLSFYRLMEVMHSKGYIHDDTIEEVRNFYNSNEGLSIINECLRLTVSGYFAKLMDNLEIADYHDYFELSKTFDIYINLFSNEAFNQRVKKSNVSYIKRLTKHFTDKRSRDYQDIKKFVAIAFVNMGFLSEKEVVEFFKTKRKKKAE
jgi:predicted transcriptional regulator